jgi:hypothetical protein
MRQILFFLLICCSNLSFSLEKDKKIGLFVGLSSEFTHLDINSLGNDSIKKYSIGVVPALNLGIYTDFKISDKISLCPQLLIGFYESRNYFGENKEVTDTLSMALLQIPVLFKYSILKKSNFIFGLEPSLNIANQSNLMSFNNFNIQLCLGFQRILNLKHYYIIPEFRYSYSLLNALKDNNEAYNKYFNSARFSFFSLILNFHKK